MKSLNLIIVFIFIVTIAAAQTNDELARQKYQEAKEAFENQEYIKTAQLLYEVEELLGKPNLRTQPLLIKALAEIPSWRQVKEEIARYKALKPDPSLVEYEEIMSIGKRVEDNIKIENNAYKAIEANPSISNCNSYLSDYPYGIYRDEVNWLIAKVTNTMESYYNYIDTYPNGKFLEKATQQVHFLDNLLYDKALKKNTVEAFQDYLTNSPRGEHTIESQMLIAGLIEDEAYKKATSNSYNALELCYKYIDTYPRGKYTSKVKEIISNSDKTAYIKASNDGSQYALKKYLDNYPRGAYISEIRAKLNEKIEYDTYEDALNGNFENYITKYPKGKYVNEILKKMEEQYYSNTNSSYKSKNYFSAQIYANKYLNKFPNGLYSRDVRKIYNRSTSRVNESGMKAVFFAYDLEKNTFGLGYEVLKMDDFGYSCVLRCNVDALTPTGELGEGEALTTETKNGVISFSASANFRVAYKLWVNVGAGVGYYPVYVRTDDKDLTNWVINKEKTKFAIFPTSTLSWKISEGVELKFGLIYHKGLFPQIGLGFKAK